MQLLKQAFESRWTLTFTFIAVFVLTVLNLSVYGVYLLTAVFACTFIFADDLKNIFGIMLVVLYAIVDVVVATVPWTTYALCAGIGLVCIIARLAADVVQAKGGRKFEKGKLFLPLVIASAGYLLGGVVGNFMLIEFVAVLFLSLITLALYFIALNHTKGLKNELFFIFILVAVYICGLIAVYYLQGGNLIYKITSDPVVFVGANNVHSATISVALGMIGFAGLGKGKPRDYLYYLGSAAMFGFSMITFCRIVMLISGGVFIAITVLMIRASERKKRLVIIVLIGAFFAVAALAAATVISVIEGVNIFYSLIEKLENHFLSGRDLVWTWGLEHFIEHPLFGIGFITEETIYRSLRKTLFDYTLVSMHNTLFQWLASLGIVGTFAVMPFYCKKYAIVLAKDGKDKSFILLTLLFIALTGLMDSNALLDYFIYLATVLLVVSAETAPVARKNAVKIND
ncbi:MAG: O-antigen ligase family protein [Clostridia bacterium]|nr:O-antigen ligase family protein [Clostridia bacterium]